MSSKEKIDIYEAGKRIKKANEARKQAEERLSSNLRDIEKYFESLKTKSNQIIPINGIKLDFKNTMEKAEEAIQKTQELSETLANLLEGIEY